MRPRATFVGGWIDVLWTACALVWLWGMFNLAGLLDVDLECIDGRASYRRAAFSEHVACAFRGGPRGWFLLLWHFAPLLVASRLWSSAKRLFGKKSDKEEAQ